MFLAALQDLPVEIDEAAASTAPPRWQKLRLRHAARCSGRPLPGHHPRADRHLAGLRPDLRHGQGAPAKTTLTPAFLSYQQTLPQLRLRAGRGHRLHRVRSSSSSSRCSSGRHADKDASRAHAASAQGETRRTHPRRGHPMSVVTGRTSSARDAADPDVQTAPPLEAGRLRAAGALRAVFIYPFLIQIATSFKTDPDAAAHPLSLVPNPFDRTAWKRIFGLTAGRVGADAHGGSATRSSSPSSSPSAGSSSTSWPDTRWRGCTSAAAGCRLRRRPRGHGGARCRPAHPEVPHGQLPGHLRHLHRA